MDSRLDADVPLESLPDEVLDAFDEALVLDAAAVAKALCPSTGAEMSGWIPCIFIDPSSVVSFLCPDVQAVPARLAGENRRIERLDRVRRDVGIAV